MNGLLEFFNFCALYVLEKETKKSGAEREKMFFLSRVWKRYFIGNCNKQYKSLIFHLLNFLMEILRIFLSSCIWLKRRGFFCLSSMFLWCLLHSSSAKVWKKFNYLCEKNYVKLGEIKIIFAGMEISVEHSELMILLSFSLLAFEYWLFAAKNIAEKCLFFFPQS